MKNYSLGNYICHLREKKGLSQSQLGERLGVTNKAVSRWENGSAYPSTELMLPLAKELGVSIEDLYRAVSEDKSPQTKLRKFLEYLMAHSKTVTLICLTVALIPYILFICFSNIPDKLVLAILTPVVSAMVYGMLYVMFVLFRKNPFASAKTLDFYTILLLSVMSLSYVFILVEFISYFPNGFSFALCIVPAAVMAVTHTLKRRNR